MSARHIPTREVLAFQVRATLDAYEMHVRHLAQAPQDLAQLRAANGHLDLVRGHCAAVPQLSVALVSLLLSHTRLVRACAADAENGGGAAAPEAPARLAEHLEIVAALARRCRVL
jgi:hypothetical protein